MVEKGYKAYLAYVMGSQNKVIGVCDIHTMNNFPNVFTNELCNLPPNCKVEFDIELYLGPPILFVKKKNGNMLLTFELCSKFDEKSSYFKCEFWLKEVAFVGHVVSVEGVGINPKKIEAIMECRSQRVLLKYEAF
ncbi:RNA-directed DNA polymerase-like protein [Gossypium australe]|uniref:RNA-directed DNA polymerase-like protein n=1 Tax=Gossypium australe TaxID=47621 RepID=A0A5B6VWV7_9ROSI|nr:RNA-directed DNA polymerase-like protein [Gossypium australe]